MTKNKQWQKFEAIFREAMKCRTCFDQGIAEPAYIDIAQPRWIGPKYFDATTKVLIVILNPGAGNTPEKQRSNLPFRQILYDYKNKKKSLQDLFEFQKQYIPRWGTPPGKFYNFYMDKIGLNLDEVALVNIAWCADANNKWPSKMLEKCFDSFTGRLIEILLPDIAILSGSGTHKYAKKIERLASGCKAVCTLHYAHRKGWEAERKELQRLKTVKNLSVHEQRHDYDNQR